MINFFELNVIQRFLDRYNVEKVLLIGLSNEKIINEVISYCITNNSLLYAIDPNIDIKNIIENKFNINDIQEYLEKQVIYFEGCSLDILPTLNSFDAIFINDDPNWYTLHSELNLIKKNNINFPLVFVCNNKYPHKRRDSYSNPKNIPKKFRNDFCDELCIKYIENNDVKHTKIKDKFYHAIYENTPKNGILTAIEDFLKENNNLNILEINPLEGISLIYENSTIAYIRINQIREQEKNSEFPLEGLFDKFIENNLLLKHVENLINNDINAIDEFKSEIKEKNIKIKDLENSLTNNEKELNNTKNQLSEITNENKNLTLIENKYKELIVINNKKIESIQNRLKNDPKINALKQNHIKQTNKLKNTEYYMCCFKEKIDNNNEEIEYLKNSNRISKKIINLFSFMMIISKSKITEIKTNLLLYHTIKNNNCFDIGYYLKKYPDIKKSYWCEYFSPELHYICKGFDENRKFNKYYLPAKNKKELLEYLEKMKQ